MPPKQPWVTGPAGRPGIEGRKRENVGVVTRPLGWPDSKQSTQGSPFLSPAWGGGRGLDQELLPLLEGEPLGEARIRFLIQSEATPCTQTRGEAEGTEPHDLHEDRTPCLCPPGLFQAPAPPPGRKEPRLGEAPLLLELLQLPLQRLGSTRADARGSARSRAVTTTTTQRLCARAACKRPIVRNYRESSRDFNRRRFCRDSCNVKCHPWRRTMDAVRTP